MPDSDFLRQLMVKIGNQMPQLQGAAQTRLSGNPAFITPQHDFNDLSDSFIGDDAARDAFTISDLGPLKPAFANVFQGPYEQAISKLAVHTPTVVAPEGVDPVILRHEAIHAFLNPQDEQLPTAQIMKMIPNLGQQMLKKNGYEQGEMKIEFPARATTEPGSMFMTPDEGTTAMLKYLDLLRRVAPEKAARLQKYLQVQTPTEHGRDQSVSKPNEVF